MKYLIPVVLALILVVMITALAWERPLNSGVRPGRMEVEVETVYEGSDLFVKRLNITANGATELRLSQGPGNESWMHLAASQNSDDDMQRFEVVLIADRSQELETGQRAFTWLAQIHAKNGASAGGPWRHVLPADKQLGDFVLLSLPDGEMTIGEPLVLGTIDGNEITLTVEGD